MILQPRSAQGGRAINIAAWSTPSQRGNMAASLEEDAKQSLLVCVLDCDPSAWQRIDSRIKYSDGGRDAIARRVAPRSAGSRVGWRGGAAIEQVMVFLNAFALLHRTNQLAVVGSHPAKRLCAGRSIDGHTHSILARGGVQLLLVHAAGRAGGRGCRQRGRGKGAR
jgi:hypothetical protein